MRLLDLLCIAVIDVGFFVLGDWVIEIFVEIAATSICELPIIFNKLFCPNSLLVELLAQLLTESFGFEDQKILYFFQILLCCQLIDGPTFNDFPNLNNFLYIHFNNLRNHFLIHWLSHKGVIEILEKLHLLFLNHLHIFLKLWVIGIKLRRKRFAWSTYPDPFKCFIYWWILYFRAIAWE